MPSPVRGIVTFRRAMLGALLLIPIRLHAQHVIDVIQPWFAGQPYWGSYTIGSPGPLNQQSFKPTTSNVSGGSFYWQNWSLDNPSVITSGEVEISLSEMLGDQQLLAQTRVMFDLGTPAAMWLDAFWSPVLVTPGATYFLGIRAITAVDLSGPAFSIDTPYDDGLAYVNGSPIDLVTAVDHFYDFTFRTWTMVPEPSTYVLMAAGLLALSGFARRRRKIERGDYQ